MALYYTVRVYTESAREVHSCLIHSGGNIENPWGTTHATGPAHRFLWKEEAEEALRVFLAGRSQPIYKSGRVYHVTEEPAGPPLTVDEAQRMVPITVAQSTPDQTNTIDLSVGEDLVNHKDYGRSAEVDEPLCEWLHENAATLLKRAREFERLDWLRQHPESCRALGDCRKNREAGSILCKECAAQGHGAYADVYQSYYYGRFEKLLSRIGTQVVDAQAACRRTDGGAESR